MTDWVFRQIKEKANEINDLTTNAALSVAGNFVADIIRPPSKASLLMTSLNGPATLYVHTADGRRIPLAAGQFVVNEKEDLLIKIGDTLVGAFSKGAWMAVQAFPSSRNSSPCDRLSLVTTWGRSVEDVQDFYVCPKGYLHFTRLGSSHPSMFAPGAWREAQLYSKQA